MNHQSTGLANVGSENANKNSAHQHNLDNRRRAGCLLHITSLPPHDVHKRSLNRSGNLGDQAHAFLRWIAEAGFTVWQMLPLGPVNQSRSPYQTYSSFAGDPALIDLDSLFDSSWLKGALEEQEESFETFRSYDQLTLLRFAAKAFYRALKTNELLRSEFDSFRQDKAYWLEDYCRYRAFKTSFNDAAWNTWPGPIRSYDKRACDELAKTLAGEIAEQRFLQFVFYQQIAALRSAARELNVSLFGDIPIFVAFDSADVWANQSCFKLDQDGQMSVEAGVPPDYFSETGQHWGNPHYDWEALAKDGYRWWLERLAIHLETFDIVRIDHFRGFDAVWEIPQGSRDATKGKWQSVPGEDFLRAVKKHFAHLPLVAENLGLITESVEALRKQYDLPGMVVLQFAFDGNPQNPHLLHNHERSAVCYTGTHDNDTLKGWLASLQFEELKQIKDYLSNPCDPLDWALMKHALSSTSRMCIIPMQDLLGCGAGSRMNTPGTAEGNWGWQFDWAMVGESLAADIHWQLAFYDRLGLDLELYADSV